MIGLIKDMSGQTGRLTQFVCVCSTLECNSCKDT